MTSNISGFSPITSWIFTEIKIGNKIWGISRAVQMWSQNCGPTKTHVRKKRTKISVFFANETRTRSENKNRFPQGRTPGDRAFASASGFSSNHLCAEKSVHKWRWKFRTFPPRLTISQLWQEVLLGWCHASTSPSIHVYILVLGLPSLLLQPVAIWHLTA